MHDSLQFTPGQQRIQRVNNLLRRNAGRLAANHAANRKQLTEWTEFLRWKESLIRHKARGLRYISREWRDEQLVFPWSRRAHRLCKARKALGRTILWRFRWGNQRSLGVRIA